ncbi:MAG: bHLH/Zip transcription factor [Chaenotheca gracillima]|nr:MAG: bHLH/Zip transcription factor [Chaenotheca gracillima]
MSPTLLPNPSLVAVLLVINTKAGPRFVFHYPPNARESVQASTTTWRDPFGDSLWEKGSEPSDPEEASDEEWDTQSTRFAGSRARARARRDYEPDDEDDSSDDSDAHKDKGPAWESLFGFSTSGLEHILNVHDGWNKKKFELGLEPLVYLSYPVFIRKDGTWKKKREKKAKQSKLAGSGYMKSEASNGNGKASISNLDGEAPSGHHEAGTDEDTPDEGNADADSVGSADDVRSMSMFNMVFVMNPPQLEYQTRIDEMYEHVVKKFSKALNYEQARTNWVWKQSEMILNLREKAKEEDMTITRLWNLILTKSTLAKAMSEVYLSVSASRIAHVFLNDHFDVSLQIPRVQTITDIPSYIEPQMPGLWITTANSFDQDEDSEHNTVAKNFALLLLDEVENIVRDINAEHGPPKISNPLVKFVRIAKPTMSFLEISETHNMSLQTISTLSRHLIYWRRARAIPPLHQRDKYIVSPNADMRALPRATLAYERRFPTLPSLPKMLSLLSGHPRAYSTLIPSNDHRAAYLEILAWLMKGGWVTQLRVFAFVRVSEEIRAKVDQEIVREEREAADAKAEADAEAAAAAAENESGMVNSERETATANGSAAVPGSSGISSALSNNTAPPMQHPSIVAARRASVPADGFSSPLSSPTRATAAPPTPDVLPVSPEPLIILDPHRTNAIESRYLDAVGASLSTSELRDEAWPLVFKYLNGELALETIPIREGRKRKEVWRWLMAFEREGVILTIRHW